MTLEEIDAAIRVHIRHLANLQLRRDRLVAMRPGDGRRGPIVLGRKPVKRRKLQQSERDVVKLIDVDPEHAWATAELIEELEYTEKTVKNALTRLCRDGRIVRVRRGFYRAVPPEAFK